jgi:hypothetical protein
MIGFGCDQSTEKMNVWHIEAGRDIKAAVSCSSPHLSKLAHHEGFRLR